MIDVNMDEMGFAILTLPLEAIQQETGAYSIHEVPYWKRSCHCSRPHC
jgi:hypothetical protein